MTMKKKCKKKCSHHLDKILQIVCDRKVLNGSNKSLFLFEKGFNICSFLCCRRLRSVRLRIVGQTTFLQFWKRVLKNPIKRRCNAVRVKAERLPSLNLSPFLSLSLSFPSLCLSFFIPYPLSYIQEESSFNTSYPIRAVRGQRAACLQSS